nr:MAG TPA: hypothetical protein [Caudoviricetes sp.]
MTVSILSSTALRIILSIVVFFMMCLFPAYRLALSYGLIIHAMRVNVKRKNTKNRKKSRSAAGIILRRSCCVRTSHKCPTNGTQMVHKCPPAEIEKR